MRQQPIRPPGSAPMQAPSWMRASHARSATRSSTPLAAPNVSHASQSGQDLLPYRGRARVVAGSRRALLVLEGVDLAGEAVYMTASALDQAQQLQAQHVDAMAGLYKQLVDLQASTPASDPRLLAIQAEFEQRAEAVRGATMEAFAAMAKQWAIFLGAKHIFHGLQQGAAAGSSVSGAPHPPRVWSRRRATPIPRRDARWRLTRSMRSGGAGVRFSGIAPRGWALAAGRGRPPRPCARRRRA